MHIDICIYTLSLFNIHCSLTLSHKLCKNYMHMMLTKIETKKIKENRIHFCIE